MILLDPVRKRDESIISNSLKVIMLKVYLELFDGCCLKHHHQCDQIGRFLNVPGSKFSFKTTPNNWQHCGLFLSFVFSYNCFGYLGATYGTVWATLFSNIWSY